MYPSVGHTSKCLFNVKPFLKIKKIERNEKTPWLMLLALSILTMSLPACKTKEGCDTSSYRTRMDGKKTKRGKSNLFDKSTRRRMN